ncbi:hypothetical protein BC567DRAFT_78916 [Phyllosticta citribraziliensis]
MVMACSRPSRSKHRCVGERRGVWAGRWPAVEAWQRCPHDRNWNVSGSWRQEAISRQVRRFRSPFTCALWHQQSTRRPFLPETDRV